MRSVIIPHFLNIFRYSFLTGKNVQKRREGETSTGGTGVRTGAGKAIRKTLLYPLENWMFAETGIVTARPMRGVVNPRMAIPEKSAPTVAE